VAVRDWPYDLGLVELAILTLFYARIPVAIGIVLGMREEPRKR
jgi:hypothetical protein